VNQETKTVNCIVDPELERLRARLARAKELLREAQGSGITCNDFRLDYVDMNVDRVTLNAIEAFLKE
jgi:hypothetical protein